MFRVFLLGRRMRCQSGANGEKIAAAANDPHVLVPWSCGRLADGPQPPKDFGHNMQIRCFHQTTQRGPYRERESSDFFLGFPVSHFGRQRKNLPHGQRERSLANDEISSGESYNGSSSIFSFSYSRSCSRVMLRCQSRPLSASNSCLFFFRSIPPINLQLKLS